MLNLNWNHLHCFYQVAKASSLKDASIAMDLAPSTISEQIKKLEKSIGAKLFVRKSRLMILTAEGRRIFTYSKRMFETGTRLMDSLSDKEVGGYPVTVGIEESLADDIVTEFTSQYWDLFTPFGTVNTKSFKDADLLMNNLHSGLIDWAISFEDLQREGINSKKIGEYSLRFFVSKELYNLFRDPRDLLRSIPMARNASASRFNKHLQNYLLRNEVQPKEFIESDHINYLWRLCLRGRCVLALAQEDRIIADNEEVVSFELPERFVIQLFSLWRFQDRNLVSIRKLKELIGLDEEPVRYYDPKLQVEISDVHNDLLTNN